MTVALEQLAELVRRESGIAIKRTSYDALAAAARRTAPQHDAAGLLRALNDPVQAPALLRRLVDEVTVNETFFFRQREALDAFDWHAALDRARAAGSARVRVWVAGCSTGEEAYTLALLASEAFAPARAPVSILATDICGSALQSAAAGSYRERSMSGVSAALRSRYFERDDRGGAVVGSSLRTVVRFSRHNLCRDPAPPWGETAFDLVTCRNVLIYFDRPTAERVSTALGGAVRPGGTVLLGAADRISGDIRNANPADRSRTSGGRPGRSRQPVAPVAARARTAQAPDRRAASGDVLATALAAANEGRLADAIDLTNKLLATDPLNADAYFVRALAELNDDASAGIESLRRALFLDPDFALAAFRLGWALEARGEAGPAIRAFEQALRALDAEDGSRPSRRAGDIDPGDIATACRLRLRALAPTGETRSRSLENRARRPI